MFAKSIRWRLLLWIAFLLLCVLTGFGISSYQLNRTHRLRLVDEELETRVAALSAEARWRPPFPPGSGPPRRDFFLERRDVGRHGPPGPSGANRLRIGSPPEFRREIQLSTRVLSHFDETDPEGLYYAIWSPSAELLKNPTNAPAALQIPGRIEGDTSIHFRTRDELREAYHFTELGECILVGRSIAEDLQAMRRFGWLLAAAGMVVLGVGTGGGWLLVQGALRPVEKISSTASRIAQGNLSERIDLQETDSELGRLAGVLNSTFARLEAAFAQQKQFTADASHELRTPLAVIISETQTALSRERTGEQYRETVQVCLDTAQQMRRLTQSLMKLARFDAGQEPLEQSPLDLADTAAACVELIRPLAVEQEVRLETDLRASGTVGDPDRLGQVITNLLINAVQFNRGGGEVRITTGVHEGGALLTVFNTGPGIPAEHLPHIFERFYRVDKARARSEGHAGLGLAICKAIVEAHGGSITVSSEPGVSATFSVRLPKSG
jgi:heavy metal sensor kinase